jgi:hypothetical protein
VARGKHRKKRERRRDSVEGPTEDPPLRPTKVEGRCAYCPCGSGRIELPGPTKEDREKMRAGSRIYYKIVCHECIREVQIEDPWEPRDSGRI